MPPPPFSAFHAGSQSQQRQGPAFTVQVKPKDPPVFRGRVDDDVTTWTAKVQDFFYLTDAGDVQQVAYAATLLQDAASDWWHSLLRTRGGMRPRNFVEFADLLGQRLGSSTRVDRARAELRNIRQGQSETVRAYSTRFEALLVTCLVLVTRVHVVARRCCPSRRVRVVSFALVNAHSRLLSAPWIGHRAASRCRRLQVGLLLRGVRGIVGCRARNEPVEWRVNRTSTRHATDATPHSHTTPKSRKAESQECRKEQ